MKATDFLEKAAMDLQDRLPKDMIEGYYINPLKNERGLLCGYKVVFRIFGAYEYSESMLNEWKKILYAYEYCFSVKDGFPILTFHSALDEFLYDDFK